MSSESSNMEKKSEEPSSSTQASAATVPAIEVHENMSRCSSPNTDVIEASTSSVTGRSVSLNARASSQLSNSSNWPSTSSGSGSHFLNPFFAFNPHSIPEHYRRSSIGVEYLTSRNCMSEADGNNGEGSSQTSSSGNRTSFWSNANFLQPLGSADKNVQYQSRRRSSQAKICTLECALCRKLMLSALSDRNLSAIESVSTLSESKSCDLHAGEGVTVVASTSTAAAEAVAGTSDANGDNATKVTVSEDIINAQGTSNGSIAVSAVAKKQSTNDADRSMTPAELALIRTDIQELMNKCWPQETGDRPDFEAFKEILHDLQE